MASVVDYLSQIQKLTNTNLQILKTLNDSFYTKKNHIFTEIDNTTYVIPSFISLENKINALQENFENLVKAPETSEAYFNFDGNTRAIEVRKYSHVPDSISLQTVSSFGVESNDIFKDFMTPVPYVNLELPTLPNDIVKVNVKKIIAKNTELQELFKSKLMYVETYTDEEGEHSIVKYKESVNTAYGELYKTLLNYKEDQDYVEYDTIYDLPIRKNLGNATYIIESVVSDIIDKDLDEYVTLKLRNNLTDNRYSNTLTYKLFDDTIEKPIQVGDELINFDGTGKVVVTEVRTSTNTIVVKVVNGEYLNFIGTDSYDTDGDKDIHDLSKLRYHVAFDFDDNKYVKIPLEEDQYVYIAVAPLNSRMNIQAGWGQGLVIDTYSLKNAKGDSFKAHYDENVKNIGDVLFEMTSMITSPITELSQTEFNVLKESKPKIVAKDVSVVQINKHLNNSNTVKNIRDAYAQKKSAEVELAEVQGKIDDINSQLTSISFDDTNGLRTVYTSQLTQLNTKKNELTTVITKAIDNISMSVNSSEIPIENAKYRIRGFYVPEGLGVVKNEQLANHAIGIQVQYRYKNTSVEVGNAISMTGRNNETYIYSDWNVMPGFNKAKTALCVDGKYSYGYEPSNENINEPSYNQIDIPISQGESVDIRVRVVYDFGQPYITLTSAWSDIINIPFPVEYTKDVPILTIIEENNNDIETNRFNNILKEEGVDGHIKDSVKDQDIVYYHKPDSIASGFYTNERRVIPLSDKLKTMSDDIAKILSEVVGSDDALTISISSEDTNTIIHPNQDNMVMLTPYNELVQKVSGTLAENKSETIGGYEIFKYNNNTTPFSVTTILNLTIANTSENVVNLYSIIPGNVDTPINNFNNTRVDKADYTDGTGGVHYDWVGRKTGDNTLQKGNQFILFRTKDLWTGTKYYSSSANASTSGVQSSTSLPVLSGNQSSLVVYPFLSDKKGMCMNTNEIRTYKTINPGTEIVIPIKCQFTYTTGSTGELNKYISFDLKTSLYKDPVNYLVKFVVKRDDTVEDKVFRTHKVSLFNRLLKPIKYNIISK